MVKKKGKEKVMLQNGNRRILDDIKERLEQKWKTEGKKEMVGSVEVRAVQ